ncbi:hypothetical protein QA646_11180 [Rhizobium sp. CB3090]|uniref:hypothetical protein n=1 Tax=Rhizobium sp. CB3090 TaxID=3039156 RepID=UPI0024B25B38|nr:hypothetical protein [Rhizobium sp. CB3090]WFU07881.1 hypothetical protein QA646_11180 [Rhizobium sp. CB3090]
MKPVVASEVNFVRNILIEAGGVPTNYLRYMLLPNEFGEILNTVTNPSSTEGQILSGLINARVINAVNSSDMTKNIKANLVDIDPKYIELSLMCGKHFVHFIEITQKNASEFLKYDITTHHADNINYTDILGEHKTNVIKSWNLVDGDTQCISDHALKYLNHIASIKIYDRYFTPHALKALETLFSKYAGIFGKFPGSLSIYLGAGPSGGLSIPGITGVMSSWVDASKLRILTSSRVGNLFVHDRVMQLDNDYTFEFTAGLNCYFENGGKNRTSTVHLRSIVADYTEFEIKDQSGNIIKFRF